MSEAKGGKAKVVQLPAKDKKVSEQKWGKAVMKHGFNLLPSLLFKAQGRLGLNPTQLAILVHLADFWWDPAKKPYPRKQLLSERLGIGPRQIQRVISQLEGAGLVKRVARYGQDGERTSNGYDISGLVKRLQGLEPEFMQAEEIAKAARKRAATPISKRSDAGGK